MKKIDYRKEDSKTIVKYEPVLNSISFKGLNPLELNIFFAMIYRLKDNETNEVVLTFDEIKTLSQYDKSRRDPARFKNHLHNVYSKILKIDFRIETEEVEGFGNLFSCFLISKIDPTVTIKVNKEFAYIFNELSLYTSFDLLEYTSLKSTYSKKIFTLIKQFEKTGWVEIKYQEFRELLDVPKSYYPKDIERQILKPVENELKVFFKKFKYMKKVLGNKIISIRFTWAIIKSTPEPYESPVNPTVINNNKFNNSNKFNNELPVVNRATEKSAIEYSQKHEENQKKSTEINKNVNDFYNEINSLPTEIQSMLTDKAYSNLLKESNNSDNKVMKGIFEKSKKSLIVKEYEKYIESLEKENNETNIKIPVEVNKIVSIKNIEDYNNIQEELNINPYEINEFNYDITYGDFSKEIEHYLRTFDFISIDFKENIIKESIENFLKKNTFFDETILKNTEVENLKLILGSYLAQSTKNLFFPKKEIQISIRKKYTMDTIPEELLLDKRGRKLVGSAKENRIEKLLRENKS